MIYLQDYIYINVLGENAVDIVFIIHFNPQRSENEFKQLVDYIQSMLNTADIDGGKVRASVILSPAYKVYDFQGQVYKYQQNKDNC